MLPACQLAYAFLQRQGRSEEADRYRKRAEEQYERLARAQQERAGVSDRDRFEPHGLPAETVERLREQLARIDRVGAAYLARKVVSLFPEKPFYVLAVRPRVAWYQFRSEVKDAKLSNQLASQIQWPGEALVIVLGPQTRRLGKRLRQVPGAEIFRR
jgi:hypothetical protein